MLSHWANAHGGRAVRPQFLQETKRLLDGGIKAFLNVLEAYMSEKMWLSAPTKG